MRVNEYKHLAILSLDHRLVGYQTHIEGAIYQHQQLWRPNPRPVVLTIFDANSVNFEEQIDQIQNTELKVWKEWTDSIYMSDIGNYFRQEYEGDSSKICTSPPGKYCRIRFKEEALQAILADEMFDSSNQISIASLVKSQIK